MATAEVLLAGNNPISKIAKTIFAILKMIFEIADVTFA
jgi:hypothetical protein